MFGTTFTANLKDVRLRNIDAEHNHDKKMLLSFETVLTADIAEAAGSLARSVLDDLMERKVFKVDLPLGTAAGFNATLTHGKQEHTIHNCEDIKATLKRGKNENAEPVIAFKFWVKRSKADLEFVSDAMQDPIVCLFEVRQLSLAATA